MNDPITTVAVQDLTKAFRGVAAVDDVSFEVQRGEFFSILGPSGSGKTTLLRMLGGFVRPDRGRILLADQDVTGLPPFRRDVNTVFQSYALFEHLNVAENVAFGLKRRRVPRAEVSKRVGEMLEIVKLGDRARSRTSELSGGQQQRIALARALVNRPALLLLDEPLGALDLKLRREMQLELKTIQRELEITFVFVTHDQEESLTLSDRIAVMKDGRLEQVGTPTEVYEHPRNAFAAGFIGASNLLACEITDGRAQPPGLPPFALPGERRWADGERVVVSIRPEKLVVSSDRADASDAVPARSDGKAEPVGLGGGLPAVVTGVVYLGATTQLELRAANAVTLRAVSFRPSGSAAREWRVGDQADVSWDPADMRVFREDTGSEAAVATDGADPQPAAAQLTVQGRTPA